MTKKKKKWSEEVNEIVKELHQQYPIDEQVKFTEFNIGDKLQENSFWLVRYRELLQEAQSQYEYLEELLEKLMGKRYDYYRFEFDKQLDKTEIKSYYLPKDPKIGKMRRILARQKVKVDFFKTCVAGMEKQQWNMKNFLETLKGNL